MRRPLPFALALSLLLPTLASGHPHSGKAHRDATLSWAILHEDHQHMGSLDELDEIEDLQSRFGDDLLYIRDGDERYVITNRAWIDRAEDAAHWILEPAKAIAKAEARFAVSQVRSTKARVKLQSAETQLEAAIEREGLRDKEREELRRALERVREELEEIETTGERRQVTPSEQRELERRRDEAHERLEKAVSEMHSEIRDILREARNKGQATRIR